MSSEKPPRKSWGGREKALEDIGLSKWAQQELQQTLTWEAMGERREEDNDKDSSGVRDKPREMSKGLQEKMTPCQAIRQAWGTHTLFSLRAES